MRPLRPSYPDTARAKRYRFPAIKIRAFRFRVWVEGNLDSRCSSRYALSWARISWLERSRYGARSLSRRDRGATGTPSLLPQVDPVRGWTVHHAANPPPPPEGRRPDGGNRG